MEHFTLLVPGARETHDTITVTAPFDNSPIATVNYGDADTVDTALVTAQRLYKHRDGWLKPYERVEILRNVVEIMIEQRDMLALEAAREGGKPLRDSQVEIDRAIDGVRLCIEIIRSDQGHLIPMRTTASSAHRLAFTQKEPRGPVVAISAFNHPLNLIIHQVAAAVAVGCPVIVKPATETALSCMRIVNIFHQAGLLPEWCQAMVIKDKKIATKLVVDERVAFFSFIGSAQVGWSLRSQLAPGTRCALEHGGVAPVIVAEDADLEKAVPLLVKGGFYHSGQVCVSVQRIFAHRSIAKKLAEKMANAAEKLVVGDPTLPETEAGPLIRTTENDRVATWVDEAVNAGAKLFCGGKKISDSCYAPTILFAPPMDAKVSQHEVFGPVICIYSYENMDDAIEEANNLPFAFQAAIFTKDIDRAMRAFSRLDASAVMVNDHTAFRVDGMPFAGLRKSGLGIGGIPYTMEDMQIEKMMVLQSSEL
jgi:acyl-CoA reductase-like NAD-dependent aldehyde dehydrogenase